MVSGIGIDIIDVKRIRDAHQKWGERFLERIFTKREIELSRKNSDFYQSLSGRFAAKEACIKAFGERIFQFREMEILNDEKGRPYINLHRKIHFEIRINLSISHEKDYAVAMVVMERI